MASEANKDGEQQFGNHAESSIAKRVPVSEPRKFTRKRKNVKQSAEPARRPLEPRAESAPEQLASAEEQARIQKLHAEALKREAEAKALEEAEKQAEVERKAQAEMARRRAAEQAQLEEQQSALRDAMDRRSAEELAEEALIDAKKQEAQQRMAERTRRAAEKARQAAQLIDAPLPEPKAVPKADLATRRSKAKVMLSPQTRVDVPPSDAKLAEVPVAPEPMPEPDPHVSWDALWTFSVDKKHLDRNRIITAGRQDPAHAAFDILRTRLLQALRDRGWHRVAVTSPTKNCGKTFSAANLAISLSRQENCRTVLLDFDLRNPSLHKVMGVENPGSIGDMLRGKVSPKDHLRRMGKNQIHAGHNIAFGFNDVVEPYASELLQETATAEVLEKIQQSFAPDIMLFDLPPALYHDDVMGLRPVFDGVLLVVGGGVTTPKEVKAVEQRLGADTPLLGTVLNYAEGTNITKYSY